MTDLAKMIFAKLGVEPNEEFIPKGETTVFRVTEELKFQYKDETGVWHDVDAQPGSEDMGQ